MFLEKFGIFILFLGPLVFFHELGHYLFARLFGVRVEVFSIGFGPKLFKVKKGDTEYAVSLIPLGGYVKMFGDDPLRRDEIPEEEKKYSFTYKNKWARFWIVLGGPLANFIMAYFIFFSLLMMGERLPEIQLGNVPVESKFYELGFRSGDVIHKVNDNDVYNPTDMMGQDGEMIRVVQVRRLDQSVDVKVGLEGTRFFDEFVNYPPPLRSPLVVDEKGNTFALSSDANKVDFRYSLEQFDQLFQGDIKLVPVEISSRGPKGSFKIIEGLGPVKSISFQGGGLAKILKAENLYPLDLKVKSVNIKSPADKAGIRGGDIVYAINGVDVFSFYELRKTLQKTKTKSVDLSIWRKGKSLNLSMIPDVTQRGNQKIKLIGVYSSAEFLGINFIETKSKGLVGSFLSAFGRTWDSVVKTADSFKKLVTAEVSFKSVGGPLSIGKVASDSFNTSISYFFQLMALISINLGIINLFPIPVLDGGHIMFIFLEILNRGPVSRRKMEIAQQLGLSLLLLLMIGAIVNDFSRLF
jgi:regulator of sigma E protease